MGPPRFSATNNSKIPFPASYIAFELGSEPPKGPMLTKLHHGPSTPNCKIKFIRFKIF